MLFDMVLLAILAYNYTYVEILDEDSNNNLDQGKNADKPVEENPKNEFENVSHMWTFSLPKFWICLEECT